MLLLLPMLIFLLSLSSGLVAESKPQPKTNLAERPTQKLFASLRLSDLSASNKELAAQLEILPKLEELFDRNHPVSTERALILREEIMETIMESYFDAASFIGEADREQTRLEALRETVVGKRDRAVQTNNAVNFMASGTLNTIGAVLGFPKNAIPFPGNLNQMLSGVVSTGMSMYALKQNAGGKIVGTRSPTLLAELFGRPVDDRTRYPESVWRFFHGRHPDQADMTRAEYLENLWISQDRLEQHGSKREQLKLDLVCGVDSPNKKMTADDLSDQIDMIDDLGAAASQMVHHLRDLHRMIDPHAFD
ncbi:MAG TPA: hypothetical protein V6C72_08150 [Chroococcales cyanobacterium]